MSRLSAFGSSSHSVSTDLRAMRHEPTLTVGNDPIDTPLNELICNVQAIGL